MHNVLRTPPHDEDSLLRLHSLLTLRKFPQQHHCLLRCGAADVVAAVVVCTKIEHS